MFISMLSLRMGEGGGTERAPCAADRIGFVCDEWGCHRRWQVCVQYMWMYNTLCIPWQAGSLFVPIISISFHLWLLMADVVTEGCSVAAAHRLSILWKRKWDTKLTDVLKLLLFFLPLLFLKSLRVGGKFRLEFLPLQTFLRPCLHSTLQCIWGDLITC